MIPVSWTQPWLDSTEPSVSPGQIAVVRLVSLFRLVNDIVQEERQQQRTVTFFQSLAWLREHILAIKPKPVRFIVIVTYKCLMVMWIAEILWYFFGVMQSWVTASEILCPRLSPQQGNRDSDVRENKP